MSRDPYLRLEDILDACERLHAYLLKQACLRLLQR